MNEYNYTLNFTDVTNYLEIHEIIQNDLDFPDYYGKNLDALYDCLTEMSCEIELVNAGVVDKDCLYKEIDFSPRFTVTHYTELRYITGYENKGVSDSVHGGVVWYDMVMEL